MTDRDGAAHRVNPLVVVRDTKVIQQCQHLNRESLIDFEEVNIIDAKAGASECFFSAQH